MSETVRGSRRVNSGNTLTNAISFLVEQEIKRQVNTAEIMAVNSSDTQRNTSPGGRGPAVFTNGIINRQNGIKNEGGGIMDENVTVKTHLHNGVQPGLGHTAQPVAGT